MPEICRKSDTLASAPVVILYPLEGREAVLKIKTDIRSGRTHDNMVFQKYLKAITRFSNHRLLLNRSNNLYAKTAVAGVRG